MVQELGVGSEGVLANLAELKRGDCRWESGRVFGHAFFSEPKHRATVERAHSEMVWENGLDPTLFPSLALLENELIHQVLDLVGAPAGACGTFTSGGTESILLAAKAARDGRSNGRKGNILLADTAHPAFHKAALYLGLEVRPVQVQAPDFIPDAKDFANLLDEATILMVGSAPSFPHGVMDPIEELGELAERRGVWLHVDGCMGALQLPFAAELGRQVPRWSFDIDGVASLSVDFHKYGYAPKGASAILYRNAALREHQVFCHGAWAGYPLLNPTVQSTRSGSALAAAWASIGMLGREGLKRNTEALWKTTDALAAGIRRAGGEILGRPVMSLLAFNFPGVDSFGLADQLTRRGWVPHVQFETGNCPPSLHLTVLPIHGTIVEDFFDDLAEALATTPPPPCQVTIEGVVGDLLSNPAQQLPEARAPLYHFLNRCSPGERGQLMLRLYNRIFPPIPH